MGHDLAAVEFRQPNLAELQDYRGTVGTERERAGKKNILTFIIPYCQPFNSLSLCLLKIISLIILQGVKGLLPLN